MDDVGFVRAYFDHDDFCARSRLAAARHGLLFRSNDPTICHCEQGSAGRHRPVKAGMTIEPFDALAAGTERMAVAILKQERQIVIEHAADGVLTGKRPIKNLEASLSGRCGGRARRQRGDAQRRAGHAEGGECGARWLCDSNRNRLQVAPFNGSLRRSHFGTVLTCNMSMI